MSGVMDELKIELRMENCANCRYFQQTGTANIEKVNVKIGQCRINPPAPVLPVAAHDSRQVNVQIGFQVGAAAWPVVTARDWCGKHPQLVEKTKAAGVLTATLPKGGLS